MSKNKPVKMIPPETNKRLSGDDGKTVLAVTPSRNADSPDQANIINVPDFSTALTVVNQEACLTVKTQEGDIEVYHRFETEADLEANSQVESTMLEKAGALFRIPQTRAMLIKKAFLSAWSKQLKDPKSRVYYTDLLADEAAKEVEIKKLKEAAAYIRDIHNKNS